MSLSVFDLFKIGIGPSSSHTVGPMRAAARFAEGLCRDGLLSQTASVKAELYGSLGATGKGHGSDKAVLLGLEGELPEAVDTALIPQRLQAISGSGELKLLGEKPIILIGIRGMRDGTYDKYGYRAAMETQSDVGILGFVGLTDVETQALLLSGLGRGGGSVQGAGLDDALRSAVRKLSVRLAPEHTRAATRVADRVVVLRLGRNNGVFDARTVTTETLVGAITGAEAHA